MWFSSPLATANLAALLVLLSSQPAIADEPFFTDLEGYQDGKYGRKPVQTFHSSDAVAPIYQVNTFDMYKIDTDEPYIFMCGNYGGWGPSIVSSKDLSLVWDGPHFGGLAQTTRSWENFHGQRVLTVYVGGAVRIFDQNYKEIHTVKPQGDLKGVTPDSHEAMLTEDGTVLLIACPGTPVDLTPVGGPASGKQVHNCHIQEMDPESNAVLFQWATLDYFSVEDSYWNYKGENVWDFSHMNSVEKTPEGDFLISYRHLSCVILVDGKTAEVIWVMWGKRNMFKDVTVGGSAEFHYQHEPRITGKNRFTLFDNHQASNNGFCTEGGCSRGMEVEYDTEELTVRMINEWYHPQGLISASRGGVQRLPSGNIAVAWGQNPMYTEHDSQGNVVMDVQRGQVPGEGLGTINDLITYRIWKGQWDASPPWGPNISAFDKNIFISWNGATKVDQWVLLMDDSKSGLNGGEKVDQWSGRLGFETELEPTSHKKYARAAAVDLDGNIIGSTPVVEISTGELLHVDYEIEDIGQRFDFEHPGDSNHKHSRSSIFGGFIIFGVGVSTGLVIGLAIVWLVSWRRRRRTQRLRPAAHQAGAADDARYGLLEPGDVDDPDGDYHEDENGDHKDGMAPESVRMQRR